MEAVIEIIVQAWISINTKLLRAEEINQPKMMKLVSETVFNQFWKF